MVKNRLLMVIRVFMSYSLCDPKIYKSFCILNPLPGLSLFLQNPEHNGWDPIKSEIMGKPITRAEDINIEQIILNGRSEALKKLPRFVFKIFAWIIKEGEMNNILSKYPDDTGKDFLVKIIAELNLNVEIEGAENLPESGKCFFVANHPFGVIDGLILTHVVSRKYGTLKAIANDSFMFLPQLQPLIAPIDVFKQSSKEIALALENLYQSDVPITHFPSGEVSRVYHGKIQDNVWQKSFITKAIQSKRDIIPFHFYGRNSRLFYTVFLVRKFLGIKVDLELILLPRELFRKRNKTIRVRIGEPISYSTLDKSVSHRDWAREIRSRLYKI